MGDHDKERIYNIEQMLMFDIRRSVRYEIMIIIKGLLKLETIHGDEKARSRWNAAVIAGRNRLNYMLGYIGDSLLGAIEDFSTQEVHCEALDEVEAETGVGKEHFREKCFTTEEVLDGKA